MSSKKLRLLTITHYLTYEIEVECSDEELELMESYPSIRSDEKLPPELLAVLISPGEDGRLIDDYSEIQEAVTLEAVA